jgi:GATA-binding protein
MSLTNTTDKNPLPSIMDQLLSDSLFPPRPKPELKNEKPDDSSDDENQQNSSKHDPLASKVWRMYTKAKDTLPNGSRMENLTWRMMAMTLTKKKLNEEAAAKASSKDAMDVDQPTAKRNPTTPPAADDTTALLSSSAPPYTMIDLFNKQPHQQQKQQSTNEIYQEHDSCRTNVMVSGSMRAITTSDQIPQFTVSSTYKGNITSISNTSIL